MEREPKEKLRIARPAALLIVGVLIVAAALFLLLPGDSLGGGLEAVFYVSDKEYTRVKLSPSTQTIEIKGENGAYNIARVTADGVSMLDASCPNLDCVHQGEVTRDNASLRPMGAWIVCLPNEVSIVLEGTE